MPDGSTTSLATAEMDQRLRGVLLWRRPLIVLLHLFLIPLAFGLAFQLRVDAWGTKYWEAFSGSVLIITAIKAAFFAVFGLYRGWWRFAGMSDLVALVKAATLAALVSVAVLYLSGRLADIPRSIFLIDWGLTILMFGGARMAVRMIQESPRLLLQRPGERVPTLVVGAGHTGERLIREIRREAASGMHVVALLDDDPAKQGLRLHDVPIVGGTDQMEAAVRRYGVELIVLAVPSASRQRMSRIVTACIEAGVEFKTVPSFDQMLEGTADVSELREVDIDDLLGRETVELDLSDVKQQVGGAVVLVTGGAGSIGSELARQVARLHPARLVLMDQAESDLYFVDLELRKQHPHLDVVSVIGDVADRHRVQEVFEEHQPAWVLHAAAYKHVPLMETHIGEAVRNNVLATLNLARSAADHGARKFVLISTDKAVNPSSIMGATKRIAEQIVLGLSAMQTTSTDFRAVRFGNVLGSNGSVIPLFKKQLAEGGPLTVTDPEMTRYFMTIPEATQLVLLAGALPEAAGRICMLDMGEPVRILDLARNLIRLHGLRPDVDVKIQFTGLRPGEKRHEELMTQSESAVPTSIQRIRLVQAREADPQHVDAALNEMAQFYHAGSIAGMIRSIGMLVPECVAPLRQRWSDAHVNKPPRSPEPVAAPTGVTRSGVLYADDELAPTVRDDTL